MTNTNNWEDEFDRKFPGKIKYLSVNFGMESDVKDDIKNFISKILEKQAKAYGGCTLCYGKGYATVRETESGVSEDDDTEIYKVLNPMVTCTCDRGKQLDALLNKNK